MRNLPRMWITACGVALCATAAMGQASDPPRAPAATEARAVSVLGLGNMGAALARAFLADGRRVTVWNRTATRMQPLVAAGARGAASAADAVAASPLTVICIIEKSATSTLLAEPAVAAALRGRTLADLSTGTPAQARDNAKRVAAAGGRYLDGGIMGYPRDIGRQDGLILYSGDRAAFDEHAATLAVLAGAQRFVGTDEGAAMAVYLGLWTYYFPAITSFFEGAALAQTAGVPLAEFRELAGVMTGKVDDGIEDAVSRIAGRNYAGDQAPVDIYIPGLFLLRDEMAANKLGHMTIDSFIAYLEQASRAGHGDKDIAILFRTAGGKD
jgi:3-hydroxyisobutyrate dehydrogenase-like beta-hydroxyacid dehydrogenase